MWTRSCLRGRCEETVNKRAAGETRFQHLGEKLDARPLDLLCRTRFPNRARGGGNMPHYIILVNWTDQGIRNVKESTKRAQAAVALIEKLGGKMQLYYTMGNYDVVSIAEAPNDDVVMQASLQLGAGGNVRTTTLKAWTAAEAAKIIAKVQ